MLIQWKKQFSVGVPEIDHEHQELIELINELYAELQDENPDAAIGEFLGEIYAHIAAHFALEETIMREQGYDEISEHKRDHERLLDEIRDMMDEQEDPDAVSRERLSARLEAWFSNHFKTHDARLHRQLG